MKRGFSLIEMMLVIALFMIIITLAGVHTSYMNKFIAKSEIDLLHATCVHLQRTALSSNKPQQLIFDTTAHSYTYNGNTYHLPSTMQFGSLPGIYGPPSAPTHAINSPVTFSENTITFYPDGIIKPGTVYILDTTNNSLYALSSPIAHVSFLRKYRYDGKWQIIE